MLAGVEFILARVPLFWLALYINNNYGGSYNGMLIVAQNNKRIKQL